MMQSRNPAIFCAVVLFISIFAFAGLSQAEESNPQGALKMMMSGGKQMMNGHKKIMAKMAKMGVKDPQMQSAQTMMSNGYDMMSKADSMMATNKEEAQKMASKGAKMMLDAQNLSSVECKKNGMAKNCGMEISECQAAAKKIKQGALQWFFGGTGI